MTALLRNMTSRHIMRFQSVPNHLKTVNVHDIERNDS